MQFLIKKKLYDFMIRIRFLDLRLTSMILSYHDIQLNRITQTS